MIGYQAVDNAVETHIPQSALKELKYLLRGAGGVCFFDKSFDIRHYYYFSAADLKSPIGGFPLTISSPLQIISFFLFFK